MGMDCDKGALQRLAARQINANLRAGEVGRDLKRYRKCCLYEKISVNH